MKTKKHNSLLDSLMFKGDGFIIYKYWMNLKEYKVLTRPINTVLTTDNVDVIILQDPQYLLHPFWAKCIKNNPKKLRDFIIKNKGMVIRCNVSKTCGVFMGKGLPI